MTLITQIVHCASVKKGEIIQKDEEGGGGKKLN